MSLVVLDGAIYFLGVYPAEIKDAVRTAHGIHFFIGPDDKVKYMYSDHSSEIDVACIKLPPTHDGSLPEPLETIGIAE